MGIDSKILWLESEKWIHGGELDLLEDRARRISDIYSCKYAFGIEDGEKIISEMNNPQLLISNLYVNEPENNSSNNLDTFIEKHRKNKLKNVPILFYSEFIGNPTLSQEVFPWGNPHQEVIIDRLKKYNGMENVYFLSFYDSKEGEFLRAIEKLQSK
jgi:hypothetical protein